MQKALVLSPLQWCPQKISHQQHLHIPRKKNQAIKNNLGGNEISIIDCKAVYPTHLKCRRRWRRPESPHVGWGCMHARLERRRREKKKKRGWGRSRVERRNKQTVERKKKKKTPKRPIRKRSLRERHCYRLAHTLLLLLLLLFFFAAPAKVSRVGSNGKGKRWSEPISHIRGGLFAPSLSCA